MMAEKLFPHGVNTSTLMAVIRNLTPEARDTLFSKLGWGSEDELRQLVDGTTVPAHEVREAEKMKYPEYRAHKLLSVYMPPILLVLGTFGNICSFLVLRRKAMARQSIHHFLAALAVLDSLVLYVGLLRKWMGELTGKDVKNEGQWLCKVIVVLGYTCSNVSVWIIVAITIERYIVTCHPLKAFWVCNVTRAKRGVVGIALLFLCINLHFLWTAGLTYRENDHRRYCSSQEEHDFLLTAVWPWVDTFLYGFGPFVTIITVNIVIIVHLIKATSDRVALQNRCSLRIPTRSRRTSTKNHNNNSQHQLLSLLRSSKNCSMASAKGAGHSSLSSFSSITINSTTTTCNSLALPGTHASFRIQSGRGISLNMMNNRRFTSNNNVRMTIMLLTVSFAFLFTTLPMNVCVIASAMWNRQSDDLGHMIHFQLAFTVAELLMYLSHSINFFLYCATGHKFRREMRRTMCGKNSQRLCFDHSQAHLLLQELYH